jgi:hypothetical protein
MVVFSACQKQWLDRKPQNLLIDSQIWGDPSMITGLLANYYERLPTDMGIDGNWRNMADYDDAMWSGYSGEDGRSNLTYANSRWQLWDYGLIRDINLAIENIAQFSPKSTPVQIASNAQFTAEFRFIRAYQYFELVKREGGVPIITNQLIYDYSGDASPLRHARNKESEVYDFIGTEMDAIKDVVGNITPSGPSQNRANKYTCLALKCRAMLYAGSLAKYNNLMPAPITTPGGEVGIPASMATGFYTKALQAAQDIITSGQYVLYNSNPDKAQNYYDAVCKKTQNKEVIMARDFLSAKAKRHSFSYDNIARGIREDNLAGSGITPSLNYVEAFEYLDGTPGALKIRTTDNSDYIYYTNLIDVFANKDNRLAGTVMLPGSTFKGLSLDMQAGVKVWTGSAYTTTTSSTLGSAYTDGKLLTSSSGPHASIQEVTNTGFYLKKFIDQGSGTSTRGILSDMWWVRYRLAEIYLNAAEAAFELGQTSVALPYINAIRQRAGFPANSLDATTLTMARIQNERRLELAFEDHRVWDLKRWRIADKIWTGSASNPDDVIYALFPYRVIRPGDPLRDGKYVFEKIRAPRFVLPRIFQMYNYYSTISQNVINNNPLIVPNPFQ